VAIAYDLTGWHDCILGHAHVAEHVVDVNDADWGVSHDLNIDSNRVEIGALVLGREHEGGRRGIEDLQLMRIARDDADLVGRG